ncbi:MAG: flagellar biosynthesis anti-sigma factor FlgM [Acidobacteriota bacterium]
MKIEQLNGGSNEPARAINRSENSRSEKSGLASGSLVNSSTSATDAVKISSRAETLFKLSAQLSKLPDVRQERVDSLRTLVASGEFRPSAEDIVDSLIRFEDPFSRK